MVDEAGEPIMTVSVQGILHKYAVRRGEFSGKKDHKKKVKSTRKSSISSGDLVVDQGADSKEVEPALATIKCHNHGAGMNINATFVNRIKPASDSVSLDDRVSDNDIMEMPLKLVVSSESSLGR